MSHVRTQSGLFRDFALVRGPFGSLPAPQKFCARDASLKKSTSLFSVCCALLPSLFCMCSSVNSFVFMFPHALCKKHPGGGRVHFFRLQVPLYEWLAKQARRSLSVRARRSKIDAANPS